MNKNLRIGPNILEFHMIRELYTVFHKKDSFFFIIHNNDQFTQNFYQS